MEFEIGQKVELNDLGKRQVEGHAARRPRRHGEVMGRSKAYTGSLRIKWQSRKCVELLHEDFVKPVSEFVDERPAQFGLWKPIETAPKDGGHILLCNMLGLPYEGFWEYDHTHEGWYIANSHWTDAVDGQQFPEWWMPMPIRPEI